MKLLEGQVSGRGHVAAQGYQARLMSFLKYLITAQLSAISGLLLVSQHSMCQQKCNKNTTKMRDECCAKITQL